MPELCALVRAEYSLLGSEAEPRTECSSSSLRAAEFRLLLLTALRRAEEAREAAVLASATIWGEEEGEEVVEARVRPFGGQSSWRPALGYQCEGRAGDFQTGK